jgi:hypothetical protein
MEIERGDRILPGCGLHELRRGKDALANELVCRADADAEPHRGCVGADRDCEYFGKMPRENGPETLNLVLFGY